MYLPTCIEEMIKEYSGHRPLRHRPDYTFVRTGYVRANMLMGYDITILDEHHGIQDEYFRVFKSDDDPPERFLGVLRIVHLYDGRVLPVFMPVSEKIRLPYLKCMPTLWPYAYRPRLEKMLKSAQTFVPDRNEVVVVPDFEAGKFVRVSDSKKKLWSFFHGPPRTARTLEDHWRETR